MKRLLLVFLITLVGMVSLAATLGAQDHKGLWVGTATLKYVSEVNKQYSDLSFDLGLIGVKAHDTLISQGDTWKYESTGTDLGSVWVDPDPSVYDDSGWSSGPAPLSQQNQTTIYCRKAFSVTLPPGVDIISDYYSNLKVRLWRDDGIVLYLNGQEIFRNNLPTGSITFNTFALSEITGVPPLVALVEFTLPATLLQQGQNLLAAEIHQADTSTDLLFDLELTAALQEPPTTQLIAMETTGWMFNDSGTDPGTTWMTLGYDDSGWSTGQGQFGYGENDEQTTVSESASTVYFRKTFSGNSADFTHLRVLLLRDDGAVVYVNGNPILRSNMPTGTIGYGTPPVKALGSADEGRYIVVDVDVPTLTGNDLLAVELHQHPAELGGLAGGGAPALTRTSSPLDLRLLFHVDGQDQVRLLKEVIQVYDDINQEYVLLTDHTLVPNYTGVAIRDGVPVGRRLSAVGFDFVGTHLQCTGGVSQTGTVDCSITLLSNHPTNPFLHRYHPDHDNMDERYENPVVEAYAVTRTINLSFSDRYPPDTDLPERAVKPAGWGFDMLGGYYTETLTGLHKDAITVSGPFIMRRVVTTDTLTP
jgi:hypothetical protein